MGDTFDFVTENRDQASLAEKIKILNDYVWVVDVGSSAKYEKYFFAASPKTLNSDEGANWEGKIGAIKSLVEDGLADQRNVFLKKFNAVQGEVVDSTSKVSGLHAQTKNLDEKVEALQKMATKQGKQIQQIHDNLEKMMNRK